jgi:hypothetical protein
MTVRNWPLADIRYPEKSFSPYRPFRFLNFHRCHRQQPTHTCLSAMILRFPKPVIGRELPVKVSVNCG